MFFVLHRGFILFPHLVLGVEILRLQEGPGTEVGWPGLALRHCDPTATLDIDCGYLTGCLSNINLTYNLLLNPKRLSWYHVHDTNVPTTSTTWRLLRGMVRASAAKASMVCLEHRRSESLSLK